LQGPEGTGTNIRPLDSGGLGIEDDGGSRPNLELQSPRLLRRDRTGTRALGFIHRERTIPRYWVVLKHVQQPGNPSSVLAAAVAEEQPSLQSLQRVGKNTRSQLRSTPLLAINCIGNSRNRAISHLRWFVEKHNRNAIPGNSSSAVWRLVPKRHDSDVAVHEVKMRLKIFANQIRTSSRHYKLLIGRSRTGVTLDDYQMTQH
jgi:hypothetical protein